MKKYHITFNSSIYPKLEEIFSYISTESSKAALDVIDDIEKQIMSLESMPERFTAIPEKITYKNYQIRHLYSAPQFSDHLLNF